MKRWFYIAATLALLALGINFMLYRFSPPVISGVTPPPQEFLSPQHPRKTAFSLPLPQREKSACYRAYDKLFRSPTIRIRIAFGYKDSRPSRFVGDRYERLMLVHYLISPCVSGQWACGFARDRNDADLFTKEGVELRVTSSSVGPDDELNRKDPLQPVQSAHSESNFLDGVKGADVVFYNGHSRDGGGPDFAPPLLTPANSVDYSWYMAQKPGEKRLLAALTGKRDPLILGLFSCRSGDHFLAEIEKLAKVATISSPRLYFYSDALRSTLEALNALLGRWCESDFHDALNPKDGFGRARLKSFF